MRNYWWSNAEYGCEKNQTICRLWMLLALASAIELWEFQPKNKNGCLVYWLAFTINEFGMCDYRKSMKMEMPRIYLYIIYNHIHISIWYIYTYHAPVYSVSEACKNWCACNVQSSPHTNSLTPPQCKHCNYPPWIWLVTTMGFMFRSRIVAFKKK